MAVYAVGDIQGCVVALEELLDDIRFDHNKDKLWLTGDLVNRGPKSLETLRLVKSLGKSVVTVLGNHDLHLIAVAAGIKNMRPGDTLKKILRASDCDELIHWVRHLPLVHIDPNLRGILVHSGVYPGWGPRRLQRRASEVENVLRGDDYVDFLRVMYGREPSAWHPQLNGMERYRFITNALTRMRFIDKRRRLNFDCKGPPGSQPARLMPWYQHPKMKCRKWRIVCGHWSSLGYVRTGRIIALDSGCVWGGALTAVRLDSKSQKQLWQVDCHN